ncbi:Lysosome membrane protein 2, partial [Zootermopsis nevadensis]
QNLELKEGSERREIWEKAPYPMDFKIYLFNVTNPMEVQKGATPVVQEVGPYCYKEDKEKVNIVDHEDDDTVSFNLRNTWHFHQEESGRLTGDEIVTIPHVLLLGMVLTAQREQPLGLKFINVAIPNIFDNPTSVFVTAPAKDLLFDGVLFNCTASDFSTKAVCSELKKRAHNFHRVSEDTFKFSLFGSKNGTVRERLEVKRGIENIKDLGKLVEFKDQSVQNVWNGEKCNELRGTDSSIFPPFLTKKDKIESFLPELCRSLNVLYAGPTVFKGLKGRIYSADFGDMSNDPDLKCFCTTPKSCLKRGVHDLTRCTGAPLAVSFPHFFLAHEDYLNDVTGLHPQKALHATTLHFEPLTGTPMLGYKRLQFNIIIRKVNKFAPMKNLRAMLFPIFWVDEGLELDDKYVSQMKSIFTIFSIVDAVKWIMVVVG